jgi:RNA polymerase sigma-70 factor (ECF subfamily)
MDPVDDQPLDARLSRMSTRWTLVRKAHGGPGRAERAAQDALMERYHGAVYRYLLGAVRDADAADELFQEFALRFVRGDFRRADPERGRFRDYLKTSLRRLVTDHYRRQGKRPARLDTAQAAGVAAPKDEGAEPDAEFLRSWRDELLAQAWEALREVEEASGQPYYSALRLRASAPELRSEGMAARLAAALGREFTSAGVRKTLERARRRFAELLREEVSRSLGSPPDDVVEDELGVLGLLAYCR